MLFSVMDLVTPIPDFALPEHANLDKTLSRITNPNQPWMAASGVSSAAGGLNNGQLVSGSQPWSQTANGKGGILDNQGQGQTGTNPLAPSAFLAPTKANHSDQLMKLIKGMVHRTSRLLPQKSRTAPAVTGGCGRRPTLRRSPPRGFPSSS